MAALVSENLSLPDQSWQNLTVWSGMISVSPTTSQTLSGIVRLGIAVSEICHKQDELIR